MSGDQTACRLGVEEEEDGKLFSARPLPTRSRPEAIETPKEAWAEFRRVLGAHGVEFRFDAEAQNLARNSAAVEAVAGWCRRLKSETPRTHYNEAAPWFAKWLVGSLGPLVAVQAVSAFHQDSFLEYNAWRDPLAVGLRRALTQTPEAAYDEAVAWCLDQCRGAADWRLPAYFAAVLADDRPASHELQPLAVLKLAERQGVSLGRLSPLHLLVFDAPPAETGAWRTRTGSSYPFYSLAVSTEELCATLMAVARSNGAPAAPQLAWLFARWRTSGAAEAIIETREKGALGELAPHLSEIAVKEALDKAAGVYPRFIFRECLATGAAAHIEPILQARLADLVARHNAETARRWAEGLDAKAIGRLETLLAVNPEPMDALPAFFRDPPWRRKKRKAVDDVIVSITPMATPFACAPMDKAWMLKHPPRVACPIRDMEDLPGFLSAAEKKIEGMSDLPRPASPPAPGASGEEALIWLRARLAQLGEEVRGYAYNGTAYVNLFRTMEKLPEPLALAFWETPRLAFRSYVVWAFTGPQMLSRFGERALPGLLKLGEAKLAVALEAASRTDASEVAPMAARAFLRPRPKKDKALAARWLRRHWRTALTRLIPDAVGAPGDARDAAEAVLRWLVREEPKAAVELPALVAAYAETEPRISEAIEQVLSRDPFAQYPAKIASLPAWFAPGAFSRPRLRDGGAFPDEAIAALAEMLSFSTPDAVYAGVAMTKEICTPQSLGAFAWDLFSVWLASGAPSANSWAINALAWIGDDACARKLAAVIRRGIGGTSSRMNAALDALAGMGSDVALMNLSYLAERGRSKALQMKALEKIAAVAENRELTADELADRVVLDLDLDDRGGLDLDFGPRQFRLGFDEFLRPWVREADGRKLRQFPKPRKSDDPELAAAAVARWSLLKKDAAAIADQQLIRLEKMLATSRRVTPDVFQTLFAAHPLIRHLAQRLVWGLYDDESASTRARVTFRVSSDLTFSDWGDHPAEVDTTPEAGGLVGMVHPVHMTPDEKRAWGEIFHDYEITQPFQQLSRDVFILSEAEKSSARIGRFDGIEMQTFDVRPGGLYDWRGGDGRIESRILLACGEGAMVSFLMRSKVFGQIELKNDGGQDVPFGEIDDVTASELLLELSRIVERSRS